MNKSTNVLRHRRPDMVYIDDHLVGGGAGNPSRPNAGKYAEFITSAVRTGAGTYDLKFKDSFPILKGVRFGIVGTTAGLQGRCTAIDVKAKTATIKTEVGAVATDLANTDSLYIHLAVRNSGKNQ
jgi:hypothetical protein